MQTLPKHLLFDWGNTLMVDDPTRDDPMHKWSHLQIVPGVAEVLPKLAQRHVLAVATNAVHSKMDDVRLALARVGIAHYFKHLFCAADMGLTKENPEFWKMVLTTMGARAEDCMMIGDSLQADILPATRNGLSAIWFLHGPDDTMTMPHFLTIRNFRELLGFEVEV